MAGETRRFATQLMTRRRLDDDSTTQRLSTTLNDSTTQRLKDSRTQGRENSATRRLSTIARSRCLAGETRYATQLTTQRRLDDSTTLNDSTTRRLEDARTRGLGDSTTEDYRAVPLFGRRDTISNSTDDSTTTRRLEDARTRALGDLTAS